MTTTKEDALGLGAVLILAGGLSTRMGAPKALLKLPTGETLLDYHVGEAHRLGKPILIADNQQGFAVNDNLTDCSQSVMHIPDYQSMDVSSRSASFSTTSASEDKKPNYAKKPPKLKHSAGPLGAILAGMQYALNARHNDNSRKDTVDKDIVGSDEWLLVISCDSLVSAFDVWQQLCREPSFSVLQSPKNSEFSSVVCLQDDQRLYPLLGVYSLGLVGQLKDYLDGGNRRVMGFIAPYYEAIDIPKSWIALSNLNTPEAFANACHIKYNLD